MRIFVKLSINLALGTFFLTQCTQEKTECQPKLYECSIYLSNAQGEALIGEGLCYSPDTVAMFILNEKWDIRVVNNKIICNYSHLDRFNQTPCILYLTATDSDTLNFFIQRNQGECFDIYKIDTFKYNHSIVLEDTGNFQEKPFYHIVKNAGM